MDDRRQNANKKHHDIHAKSHSFNCDDLMYAKNFPNQKNWSPSKIDEVHGPLSYHIPLTDGRVVHRHVDAIESCSANAPIPSSHNDQDIPSPEISGSPPDNGSS